MRTYARWSLVEHGTTDHELRAFVADGRIERIRQGHYAHPDEWRDAYIEERQRALALAATDAAIEPPVVCRATAAAVYGLPLFRIRDDGTAHLLTGDTGSGTRSGSVVRHRDRWDGESVEIDGVLCEFDGAVKYQNPEMRDGRTIEEIVSDEKCREDDIRAASGKRVTRWTFEELTSRAAFLAFLGKNGIRPRQRTRFIRTDMK